MTTIITITEFKSGTGRFEFDVKVGKGTAKTGDAGQGPEAAAAKAMSIAIHHAEYVIFAPRKVLDQIPQHLHNQHRNNFK